jgi:hypothetical protein
MRKISILLALAILFPAFKQTDDARLKVIKVMGTIVMKDTQKLLSTGDDIQQKAPLDFKTPGAKAAVINLKNKSRYLLTSGTSSGSNPNDLLAMANTHLIPSAPAVSTRAATTDVSDLKEYFKDNYVVLNKAYFIISDGSYHMDATHLFYLKYKYKGEEINKRLDFSGDSLFIDKEKLYKVDNQSISKPDDNTVRLYYMSGNKSSLVSEFNLIFPDDNSLKQEVDVILKTLGTAPFSKKLDEVNAYITEFYGKPNSDNVFTWVKKNFKM